MDEAGLSAMLEGGEISGLDEAGWRVVASLAEIVRTHETGCAGSLFLIRFKGRFATVEQPRSDEWVLRPFADEAEARAFFDRRIEEYDRLWDGCGCRIDYYR